MELRHLRYFVAVAEELSFTRAAERLHIAQPPLSAQIRDLERELGVVLFFREGNRIRLTPAGEAFLGEARATLAQSQRAASAARRVADGELGVLRVGFASGALSRDVLPLALKTLKDRQSDVTVELHEAAPFEQLRSLERADIDVAVAEFANADLTSGLAAAPAFRFVPLVRTRLAVAISSESELASAPVINLRRIADQPLITSPRAGAFERWRAMLDDLYARVGQRPTVVQEVLDKSTMLSLVAVGLGVAILPDHLIGLAIPNVAFVPLEDAIDDGAVVALWRRADASLLRRRFVELLVDLTKSNREDWAHLVRAESS